MADEATTPEKKTRPRKAPQRRHYQAENAVLEQRVEMATEYLEAALEAWVGTENMGVSLARLAMKKLKGE